MGLKPDKPKTTLDLLKRVFLPIEVRGMLRTLDGTVYRRDAQTGVVRRAVPKKKGKAARRAERKARRAARGDP